MTPLHGRLAQAIIIGLSLMLALVTAACPLGVLAVQRRAILLPPFTLRLGALEFSGPCPARGFECDATVPYYSIWRGHEQPDGSVHYEMLFFMYLEPVE